MIQLFFAAGTLSFFGFRTPAAVLKISFSVYYVNRLCCWAFSKERFWHCWDRQQSLTRTETLKQQLISSWMSRLWVSWTKALNSDIWKLLRLHFVLTFVQKKREKIIKLLIYWVKLCVGTGSGLTCCCSWRPVHTGSAPGWQWCNEWGAALIGSCWW